MNKLFEEKEGSFLSRNWMNVLTIAMLALVIALPVWSFCSQKTTVREMEVNDLYEEAIFTRNQWIRSMDPNGEGGVNPESAKKKADEAFQKLQKEAVGQKVSLRVKQFILDGPIKTKLE